MITGKSSWDGFDLNRRWGGVVGPVFLSRQFSQSLTQSRRDAKVRKEAT